MKAIFHTLTASAAVCFLCACSLTSPLHVFSGASEKASVDSPKFLSSGTIVISSSIPTQTAPRASAALMGPVLGYVPPSTGLLPADNEPWLEVDSQRKMISVHRGQTVVKTMEAQGLVNLKPGTYALQVKQKKPLWYAPDNYFVRRQLPVPPSDDRQRYLKGALGTFVLYPATSFPIHCAAVWSEDVGGLRVSRADLSSIYYMLPVGATVVVK